MKNLTTTFILLTLLPVAGFGGGNPGHNTVISDQELDQAAKKVLEDAKKAFFDHDKIDMSLFQDLSLQNKILLEIIADDRFGDRNNKNNVYKGSTECTNTTEKKEILNLDHNPNESFYENIMKCNPNQYNVTMSTFKITYKSMGESEIIKLNKILVLNLLGGIYRKLKENAKKNKVKTCIENYAQVSKIPTACNDYIVETAPSVETKKSSFDLKALIAKLNKLLGL